MDFINEKDIPYREVRENASQVPRLINSGAARHFDTYAKLVGNYLGQRGLS